MSTDDPGWGEYVPVSPDDHPTTPASHGTAPSSAPASAQPPRLGGFPGGSQRIALIAGAIVVVAAIVGILVWQLGGSSNKNNKGSSHSLTVEQWASKADAICSNFLPQVNSDSTDPQAELSVVNQELSQMRALGDPSTESTTVHTYLNDVEQTAQTESSGDTSTAAQAFAQSQQLASNLGLTVCN